MSKELLTPRSSLDTTSLHDHHATLARPKPPRESLCTKLNRHKTWIVVAASLAILVSMLAVLTVADRRMGREFDEEEKGGKESVSELTEDPMSKIHQLFTQARDDKLSTTASTRRHVLIHRQAIDAITAPITQTNPSFTDEPTPLPAAVTPTPAPVPTPTTDAYASFSLSLDPTDAPDVEPESRPHPKPAPKSKPAAPCRNHRGTRVGQVVVLSPNASSIVLSGSRYTVRWTYTPFVERPPAWVDIKVNSVDGAQVWTGVIGSRVNVSTGGDVNEWIWEVGAFAVGSYRVRVVPEGKETANRRVDDLPCFADGEALPGTSRAFKISRDFDLDPAKDRFPPKSGAAKETAGSLAVLVAAALVVGVARSSRCGQDRGRGNVVLHCPIHPVVHPVIDSWESSKEHFSGLFERKETRTGHVIHEQKKMASLHLSAAILAKIKYAETEAARRSLDESRGRSSLDGGSEPTRASIDLARDDSPSRNNSTTSTTSSSSATVTAVSSPSAARPIMTSILNRLKGSNAAPAQTTPENKASVLVDVEADEDDQEAMNAFRVQKLLILQALLEQERAAAAEKAEASPEEAGEPSTEEAAEPEKDLEPVAEPDETAEPFKTEEEVKTKDDTEVSPSSDTTTVPPPAIPESPIDDAIPIPAEAAVIQPPSPKPASPTHLTPPTPTPREPTPVEFDLADYEGDSDYDDTPPPILSPIAIPAAAPPTVPTISFLPLPDASLDPFHLPATPPPTPRSPGAASLTATQSTLLSAAFPSLKRVVRRKMSTLTVNDLVPDLEGQDVDLSAELDILGGYGADDVEEIVVIDDGVDVEDVVLGGVEMEVIAEMDKAAMAAEQSVVQPTIEAAVEPNAGDPAAEIPAAEASLEPETAPDADTANLTPAAITPTPTITPSSTPEPTSTSASPKRTKTVVVRMKNGAVTEVRALPKALKMMGLTAPPAAPAPTSADTSTLKRSSGLFGKRWGAKRKEAAAATAAAEAGTLGRAKGVLQKIGEGDEEEEAPVEKVAEKRAAEMTVAEKPVVEEAVPVKEDAPAEAPAPVAVTPATSPPAAAEEDSDTDSILPAPRRTRSTKSNAKALKTLGLDGASLIPSQPPPTAPRSKSAVRKPVDTSTLLLPAKSKRMSTGPPTLAAAPALSVDVTSGEFVPISPADVASRRSFHIERSTSPVADDDEDDGGAPQRRGGELMRSKSIGAGSGGQEAPLMRRKSSGPSTATPPVRRVAPSAAAGAAMLAGRKSFHQEPTRDSFSDTLTSDPLSLPLRALRARSPLKQGFLLKPSGSPRSIFRTWKRRWFVLLEEEGVLVFFKANEGAERAMGWVRIGAGSEVRLSQVNGTRGKPALEVVVEGAVAGLKVPWHFVAEEEGDRKAWLKALQDAVEKEREKEKAKNAPEKPSPGTSVSTTPEASAPAPGRPASQKSTEVAPVLNLDVALTDRRPSAASSFHDLGGLLAGHTSPVASPRVEPVRDPAPTPTPLAATPLPKREASLQSATLPTRGASSSSLRSAQSRHSMAFTTQQPMGELVPRHHASIDSLSRGVPASSPPQPITQPALQMHGSPTPFFQHGYAETTQQEPTAALQQLPYFPPASTAAPALPTPPFGLVGGYPTPMLPGFPFPGAAASPAFPTLPLGAPVLQPTPPALVNTAALAGLDPTAAAQAAQAAAAATAAAMMAQLYDPASMMAAAAAHATAHAAQAAAAGRGAASPLPGDVAMPPLAAPPIAPPLFNPALGFYPGMMGAAAIPGAGFYPPPLPGLIPGLVAPAAETPDLQQQQQQQQQAMVAAAAATFAAFGLPFPGMAVQPQPVAPAQLLQPEAPTDASAFHPAPPPTPPATDPTPPTSHVDAGMSLQASSAGTSLASGASDDAAPAPSSRAAAALLLLESQIRSTQLKQQQLLAAQKILMAKAAQEGTPIPASLAGMVAGLGGGATEETQEAVQPVDVGIPVRTSSRRRSEQEGEKSATGAGNRASVIVGGPRSSSKTNPLTLR
ncbi:hypothetical protein HDU96_005885 [Phlyctochytrium bullatum]|nr:hypothetical protein HDU96_005885 [Phlyctochytrium bullatum]